MADILPFRKRPAERASKQARAAGEVVIFPGVRVEYHDGAPRPAKTRQAKRKRRGRSKGALSA